MKREPTQRTLERLGHERNVWMASVRRDGRPHLVPVWFVWHEACFFIGMKPNSVKAKNLRGTPLVSLSLENGDDVVICEGKVAVYDGEISADIAQKFKQKYDWEIASDTEYGLLIQVSPTKWLIWGEEGNY